MNGLGSWSKECRDFWLSMWFSRFVCTKLSLLGEYLSLEIRTRWKSLTEIFTLYEMNNIIYGSVLGIGYFEVLGSH